MKMIVNIIHSAALLLALAVVQPAQADPGQPIPDSAISEPRQTAASPGAETPEILMRNGRYEPQQLVVPAKTAFKLRVTNTDKAAIEFESFELHRERVVRPGETITVLMPALAPGSYAFVDDFNRDTPEGVIIAK